MHLACAPTRLIWINTAIDVLAFIPSVSRISNVGEWR